MVQRDMVLRFLAGLCKHSTSLSCQEVGDVLVSIYDKAPINFLIKLHVHTAFPVLQWSSNQLLFIRCLYESASIIKENYKIQDFFDGEMRISTLGRSPFDNYLIGHCISCHGGVWYVVINQLDLFVQGLKSCNGSTKGMLKVLSIHDTELLTLDQVLLPSILELISFVSVTFSPSSVAVLQQYISSNPSLKRLYILHSKHVELLLPIVFGPSSLEVIHLDTDKPLIDNHTIVNLLRNNSNLKELHLNLALKLPTSTLCDNTSLKYLANHICIFFDLTIKWNLTIQKITVKIVNEYNREYSVLGTKTNNNGKIIVNVYFNDMFSYKHCALYKSTAHQLLLLHIPEQYHKYIHVRRR